MRESGYDIKKVDHIDATVTAMAEEYDENAQAEVDALKNDLNLLKLRADLYRNLTKTIRVLEKYDKKTGGEPKAIESKKQVVAYGPHGPYVVPGEFDDEGEEDGYFWEQ